MSAEIATLEAEIKDYKLQLETLQPGLQADPDNAELQNLKVEIEELVAILEGQLAEMQPAAAPPPPPPQQQTPPPTKGAAAASPTQEKEKWSRENHPAFKPGYRKQGTTVAGSLLSPPLPPADEPERPAAATTFAVNDTVLAKWKSGDKAMWPAKITAITGAASRPVYIVRFKADGSTDTVYGFDIKPLPSESKKRKADGPPPTSNSTATAGSGPSLSQPALSSNGPSANPSIISAAAAINPALASQARGSATAAGAAGAGADGAARPPKAARKVKATKELEAGKSKWQDFSAKGHKARSGKKDSMFRTGDGVGARVGFTGSGQSMRKDATRSRHIYQQNGEEEG